MDRHRPSLGASGVLIGSFAIALSVVGQTAAPPCRGSTDRLAAEIHGDVNRGQKFETFAAGGWSLQLLPGGGGWYIAVTAKDRQSDDLSRFTPPSHGPHALHLQGWHFRNADNTAPNDGSINQPQQLREFIFSPLVDSAELTPIDAARDVRRHVQRQLESRDFEPMRGGQSSLFDRLISDRDDIRQPAVDEARGLDQASRQRLIEQLIARFQSQGLDGYYASLALGRFGEPAVAPLIAAVSGTDSNIRYRASESLGRIGAPAFEPLIRVLRDSSSGIRCAAAYALELMGAEAAGAVPVLAPLMQTTSPDLTRCVIRALGAIGSEQAFGALRSELAVEPFQPETLNALAVMHARAAPATPDVLPLLNSTNEMTRMIAARTLGQIAAPSPDVVSALVGALNDADWSTRQAAAAALGQFGPRAAPGVPALRGLLSARFTNEPVVLAAALDALGNIGPAAKDAVLEIIPFWRSENSFVRRAAVDAVGRIGPAAVPAMMDALHDRDPEVRIGAAWQLGEFHADTAVRLLAESLHDNDKAVQAAARNALQKIASPAAKAALGRETRPTAIAPRLLTLPDIEQALPPSDGDRSARSLAVTRNLQGPRISLLATIHRSDDRGDLLRIWRPVGARYRLVRVFEDTSGDPGFANYQPPEAFQLRSEHFIHVALLYSGTGGMHDDTLLWIAPDGTLHDVTFISPVTVYKGQLRQGEGVWKGESNEFTPAGARFRFGVWRDGDSNCCPTGGEVTGEYRLAGDKRYDPATKRWSARFRIEPAGLARSAGEK